MFKVNDKVVHRGDLCNEGVIVEINHPSKGMVLVKYYDDFLVVEDVEDLKLSQ